MTEVCALSGMIRELEMCCRALTAQIFVPLKDFRHAMRTVSIMNSEGKVLAGLRGKSSLCTDMLRIIPNLTTQALVFLCGCSKDRVEK